MDRIAELARLDLLLDRLHALELQVPPPHERSVHAVAKAAVEAAAREIARRLAEGGYWRRAGERAFASA